MSLIKCSECGKEFSDKAAACPNCACPIEQIDKKEEFISENKEHLKKEDTSKVGKNMLDEINKTLDKIREIKKQDGATYEEIRDNSDILADYDNKYGLKELLDKLVEQDSLRQYYYYPGLYYSGLYTVEDPRLSMKVEIRLLKGLDNKYEDIMKHFPGDKHLDELFKKFATAYNTYWNAILSQSLRSSKPVSSTTAGIAGTILGGTAVGMMAYQEQEKKQKQYMDNIRNYRGSPYNFKNAKKQVHEYFCEIENYIRTSKEVWNEWLEEKDRICGKIVLGNPEGVKKASNKKKIFVIIAIIWIIALTVAIITS